MEPIQVIDDALPAKLLNNVIHFFDYQVRWEFGSLSDREGFSFGHWNQELLKTSPRNKEDKERHLLDNEQYANIYQLWKYIKETWLTGHTLVRCYANAHTYGVEGYLHTDSRSEGNFTTIIYLNKEWKPEWAGETVFFDHTGDIYHSVLPRNGRMVLFDGRIPHAARSLSRCSSVLRQTLIFKSYYKPDKSEAEETLRQLIDSYSVQHNNYGYTVSEHSIGLYNLLENWNAEEHIRYTALFYLLYLNMAQNPPALATLRQKVTLLVGEKIEGRINCVTELYQNRCGNEYLMKGSLSELSSTPPRIAENLETSHPLFNDIITLEIALAVYTNTLYRSNKLINFARELDYLKKGVIPF